MRGEAHGAEASSPRPDRLSKRKESMRIYAKDQVCSFRFSRAVWGAFSNFQPLAVPIVAGPWVFLSSRGPVPGREIRGAPGRPATDRRSADREGGRSHRP